MNKYEQILKLFVETKKTTYTYNFQRRPFSYNNLVLATNGYVMVFFDKEQIDSEVAEIDLKVCKGLPKVLAFENTHNFVFSTKKLEESLQKCVGSSKIHNSDDDAIIQILEGRFSQIWLNKLLKVAKILSEKEITLIHQTTPNKMSVFKISDVQILIMPNRNGTMKDTIQ